MVSTAADPIDRASFSQLVRYGRATLCDHGERQGSVLLGNASVAAAAARVVTTVMSAGLSPQSRPPDQRQPLRRAGSVNRIRILLDTWRRRRTTLVAGATPKLLVAGAALVLFAATAAPTFASEPTSRFVIPADAEQLIVVSSPTSDPPAPGYLATLRAYERAAGAGWRQALEQMPAETGWGHLHGERREGDGSTPTGVFDIGATFYGNKPDPGGLHYPYRRLQCGDWWDEDPYSSSYNRFVVKPCGFTPAFAASSEALWTETVAYPYFAVIDFNVDPVVGGANAPGSGIFLHSWVGGATAGCVAVHEAQLLELLRWLYPAKHPVIEIGTDAELASLATS